MYSFVMCMYVRWKISFELADGYLKKNGQTIGSIEMIRNCLLSNYGETMLLAQCFTYCK